MPPHRYLPRAAALPWIWSLQKHPRRAIRKWLHSTHLHRSPLASRLNLRFRARQVAVAHAAFSLAAKGTDPQGHAYDCSQEGGVLMTLGEEIRGHLPYLRRYARALTGSQQHGDRSEEHPSELQSLMRITYAVFCL